VDGLIASGQLPEKKKPLGEAECLQVFRLFGELLAWDGTNGAPARVFDLVVFKKITRRSRRGVQVAASLITMRVATIGAFRHADEELRTYASDIRRPEQVKGDAMPRRSMGREGWAGAVR